MIDCFDILLNVSRPRTGHISSNAYGISACIHFFCGKWIPPPTNKVKHNKSPHRNGGVEELMELQTRNGAACAAPFLRHIDK